MADSSLTAARLIAEMIELSQSWSMPDDCADHPILGPAIAIRRSRYKDLRARDFTEARIASNTAAIQYIIDVTKS